GETSREEEKADWLMSPNRGEFSGLFRIKHVRATHRLSGKLFSSPGGAAVGSPGLHLLGTAPHPEISPARAIVALTPGVTLNQDPVALPGLGRRLIPSRSRIQGLTPAGYGRTPLWG